MGQITPHRPVLFLLAAFSRYPQALAWARHAAEARWGPVALESDPFAFTETDYYEATMGPQLAKQFWAFERLVEPATLVDAKLTTNEWEAEYAARAASGAISDVIESRPLNLDPGYLTLAKLVLASTKDHAHRIYLDRGIFAEVTLFHKHGGWQPRDWTFPDYRRTAYHDFFDRCREYYKRKLRDA